MCVCVYVRVCVCMFECMRARVCVFVPNTGTRAGVAHLLSGNKHGVGLHLSLIKLSSKAKWPQGVCVLLLATKRAWESCQSGGEAKIREANVP